ncbi:1,4-dihydroxy-2-naphthoyl-CoA hydrolase [Oceanibacterium hippocampi]|uniref:1,4-dihydroxy-2-naphthoyl-CoA hydrolase n=2 Tax=Oceanibacterium hippocampi TaxID=745714 RepID=A0A1Y5SH86_9PROT|nr:1,4-dihydroxy-2-naphthoyl-CoA hydrolase [Oceanibacterium hippocampi]
MHGTREVISRVPFTIRRTVHWGDCDPAGIVYTPRFLDFAVETAEAWFHAVTGEHWDGIRRKRNMGSPMVGTTLEFKRPLAAGDLFDLRVLLARIGGASYTLDISGLNAAGELAFRAELTPCMVHVEPFGAARIPDDFRQAMEAYKKTCDET